MAARICLGDPRHIRVHILGRAHGPLRIIVIVATTPDGALAEKDLSAIPYVCEPKDEMEGVRRGGLEVKVQVETTSFLVLGMDEETGDADSLRSRQCRIDGGPKQSRSEAVAPVLLIDGHSSQDDGRDGVRHVAVGSTGDVGVSDRCRRQCVVADHSTVFDDHMGFRASGRLIGNGSLPEPIVQFRLTAGKPGEHMLRIEGLRSLPGPVWHSVPPGRRLGQQFLEPGLVDGRTLQQSIELSPRRIINREVPTISKILFGGADRMPDHVVRDRFVLRLSGRFDDCPLLRSHAELQPV